MEKVLDNRSKKKVLYNLKNEVNDFHPILSNLFIKLPRIKKIEYTHGVNESGADFVLLRFDDTISLDEYIGVIVKVGKIHQDLSKIREQIEECDLDRTFNNGKQKIRLDEIWVITNEHITQGAKDKIYKSFSSRKIKFIQNSDLIILIDKHMPNFWYEIPLDISDYLNEVNSQIRDIEKSLSLIPNNTEDFYIEQDIEENDLEVKYNNRNKRKRQRRKIKIEKIVHVILENKIVFIEGKPGYGKSRLLRYTVSFFSNPINYLKYKLIPIFITYRELVDDYKENIEEFLSKRILKIKKVAVNPNIILIIDGFDEKLYSTDEEFGKLSSLVTKLKDINYCKSIISSRTLNYIEPQLLKSLNIKWYELLPLTLTKILSFFDKICKATQISSRIIEDIKKSHLFKQLPKSPIAAILLANLLNENSKELPSNLTELYSKYCELMLGRWDISKGLQSEKEYEAAKSIIMDIAKFFIENDLDYMALDEAKGFFDNYLKQRNLGIDCNELFKKLTSRSGIIQREDTTNRVFFKHRSFSEYFFACNIVRHPASDFINENVYTNYWRNIYFFYIGLLKDCENELQKIIDQEPSKDIYRFTRIINLADYFLAGYATPYRILSQNLSNIFKETTQLYLDVVNKKIDTPFKELPTIVNLFIFQFIIRNSYSYEYFYPAIEDSILEIISDDSLSNESKMYSLFFISVILIDLGKENPLDGLIEEFKNELPFVIQFAIMYESKEIKTHSAILKKQEKRLQKVIKHSSKELKDYFNEIHSVPVKKIKVRNKS
ncbi:MAG: NACHT domain-containing protein [Bacteroidetes bacterium]|nr:NACHT domain-containing protein [Bacteroidota bacterium]